MEQARVRLPWHRRYHREMLRLNRLHGFEAGSVLSAFVDLCCAEGGPVDDDDRLIAASMGLDIRVWRRVRRFLEERNLVHPCYLDGPGLTSPLADFIIADGLRRLSNAKKAGDASARSAAARRGEREAQLLVARSNEPLLADLRGKSEVRGNNINKLATTPVERAVQPKTDRKRKEDSADSLADQIGDVIRRSTSLAIQAGVHAAKQMKDPH